VFVPMDHKLSCQSLSSVTYLVGWHLWGSVAPNELMSHPGAVKLMLECDISTLHGEHYGIPK